MVQGTKRKKKGKEKKSQAIQGKTWKTQMNTHTQQNKNKEKKNKQKVKKPHPGQRKEGGCGGSKGQHYLARGRQRAVGRDDGWVLVGEAPGADPGDAQSWQWCQQLRRSYRLKLHR